MRAICLPWALPLLTLACAEHAAPARPVPAVMTAVTPPNSRVTVGSPAGPIVVRVADAGGTPIRGVTVSFVVSRGAGTVARGIDTTRGDGTAGSAFVAGTTPATNEVSAVVAGVAPLRFTVEGVVGPTARIAASPAFVLIPPTTNAGATTGSARDALGNPTADPVTWTPRDPSLVSVSASGNAVSFTALRRPGRTYVVGSAGSAADSVLVTVQDAASPCNMIAAPLVLAVGAASSVDSGTACIGTADPGAEFALMAHYNTAVNATTATASLTATGVVAPATPYPAALAMNAAASAAGAAGAAGAAADAGFERDLRARESRQVPAYVPGARAWYASRGAALRSPLRQGDLVQVNVNAFDFCGRPAYHSARVAAVTSSAVILADKANPSGGFTDDEYRAFGLLLDTLITPLDTGAFGAPSDVDGNGRVIVFFTSAVNQLTPPGAPSGTVLGFYYLRDLLPLVSPVGDCPASNVAEMFYVLVPDPSGTINGNARTKELVERLTPSTIAHEYQHLINASRRMYVTNAPRVDEERWLNEGLSHIAEELLFYRSSGLAPRTDIGGAALAPGSPVRAAFDADQLNNFKRYREYLKAPELNSPVADNDDLTTRGAAWSFLRYVADRIGPTDGDLWRRLVDSRRTGTPNLDDAVARNGVSSIQLLRDWSVSVLTDDVPGASAVLQQPSWNFATAMPAAGLAFGLTPSTVPDSRPVSIVLRGGATSYMRFAVPQGKEALLRFTGFGETPLPAGIRITVARIK